MFECGQCRKRFMNASQLNLHKHFHCRDRLHKHFASKCNHCYKWPQYLLRHIKIHLSTVYSCTQCPYSNKQKRLLQQHINIHTIYLSYAKDVPAISSTQCSTTGTRRQQDIINCVKLKQN